MKLIICAIALVAAAGCSPVAPWPSFHPADYSEDQVQGIPGGTVAMSCRSCPADAPTAEVCAAVHPLEKPVFCEGRTPDGTPGALVPVQLEYKNVGEARAFLQIREAEILVAGTVTPSNGYYSDFGYLDYIAPGSSRTMTVGFVVDEEVIRVADSLVITCPCPGHPGESFEFEFVARGGGRRGKGGV